MTIVRGPRIERDFTILGNAMLRDSRLSYKARGLLVCLLSRPPGYSVSAVRLADESPDGRVAVQSGLRELEEAGYLMRSTSRLPDGRFEPVSTVLECPSDVDEPRAENLRTVPPAETRESAAHTGRTKPARGEPALLEELGTEELGIEGLTTRAIAIPDPFERFWKTYPQRRGGKGHVRATAWVKALKVADAETIIAGAERYRDDPNRDDRYTAMPATWLNQQRWTDERIASRTNAPRLSASWANIDAADAALRQEPEHGAVGSGAGREDLGLDVAPGDHG